MPLDGGGVVVGEKVQIQLEIEAVLRGLLSLGQRQGSRRYA